MCSSQGTGKGGIWRETPPDAESAACPASFAGRTWRGWSRFPESAAERPHLSGARGVGRVFALGNIFL